MGDLFNNRRNIEDLMLIIQQWKKDHPKDSKAEYAAELLNKLDYMHMVW